MELERGVGVSAIVAGIVLLYAGWANVGGLIPPYSLCGYVGNPSVHLGSRFAMVYNGGCTPYKYASVTFSFLTVTGLTMTLSGLHVERQRR